MHTPPAQPSPAPAPSSTSTRARLGRALVIGACAVTILVDVVCGAWLVIDHASLLKLAGLPLGPTAPLLLPALGATLLGVAAQAALALRWTWQGLAHGPQLAAVLGVMLLGVGAAQLSTAPQPAGPALDMLRGLALVVGAGLLGLTPGPSPQNAERGDSERTNKQSLGVSGRTKP